MIPDKSLYGLQRGDLVKWNRLSPKNISDDIAVGVVIDTPNRKGNVSILIEGKIELVRWNDIVPLSMPHIR